MAGAHPERGLVLAGVVAACRPAGGGWESSLLTQGTTITFRLPELPTPVGETFTITAIDPPYFAADGAAFDSGPVEPEQVTPTLVRDP